MFTYYNKRKQVVPAYYIVLNSSYPPYPNITTVKTGLSLGFVALLLVAIFFPTVSHAQQPDFKLPNPGILPDNPFYGLKKAVEFVETTLTFGDEPRAQRALEVAQIRLAEAQEMAHADRQEFVRPLLKEYGDGLEKANGISYSLQDKEKQLGLAQKIAVATVHHISVLDDVQWRVSDNVKDSVFAAKEKSMNSSRQALMALAAEDPERAAEIAMYAAQVRVTMVRASFLRGNAEDAIQSVREYQEFIHTGDSIVLMAEQQGKDASTVKEIVRTHKSAHLRNLQGLLDDVPERGKSAIERVIADTETSLRSPATVGPKDGQGASEAGQLKDTDAPYR